MKHPYPVIENIAGQLRQFRNTFTEAPRLIREYTGLVSEDDYLPKDEAEKTEEVIREELEKLREDYETRSIYIKELREYLITGARNGFDDELVLCLIQHLAFCIHQQDPEIDLPLSKEIDQSLTALERRLADLSSPKEPQAERSASSVKDWLEYLGVKTTDLAHESPRFPLNAGFKFDDPIIGYRIGSHGLTLMSETGGYLIPEPGGPCMQSWSIHPIPRSAPPKPSAPAIPANRKPANPKPVASAPPILTRTPKGKALELRFNGIPDEGTRDSMKSHGFRWSRKRQAWLAGYSEDALAFASRLAGTDAAITAAAPESPPEPASIPETPAPLPPRSAKAATPPRRWVI